MRKTRMTSPKLACVFPSLTRDNVSSLFDIIDTSDDTDFCTVRNNKKQYLINVDDVHRFCVGLIMDQAHLRFLLFSNLRKSRFT